MSGPDWAAEGLLDGLGEDEAAARLELLDHLHGDGCELEELREAVRTDRLVILPIERRLRAGRDVSLRQAAELSGLTLEQVERNHRGLGLASVDPDQPVYTDGNVENLRRVKALVDAGVPFERLLDQGRVLGHAMARVAETLIQQMAEALIRPGDDEQTIALRYAQMTDALLPHLGEILSGPAGLHMGEVVRRQVLGRDEREARRLRGARDMAVAFVDLVGFTRLSERLDTPDLADLAERFEAVAAAAAEPPVRLVKVIGDGALLSADDGDALLRAVQRLVDDGAGAGLPPMRAGAAVGPVLRSAGDLYGRTVNVASRLTALAEPGELVAAAGLEAGGAVESHAVKGIERPVEVTRRRLR